MDIVLRFLLILLIIKLSTCATLAIDSKYSKDELIAFQIQPSQSFSRDGYEKNFNAKQLETVEEVEDFRRGGSSGGSSGGWWIFGGGRSRNSAVSTVVSGVLFFTVICTSLLL